MRSAAFALMMLLSACSGAVSSFYVEDAGSGDPLRLRRLAERTATAADKGVEYAEIIRAHRIGPGTGTVLSYREASGGYEEKVTKLTILLPDGIAVPGTTVRFSKSAAPGGAVALLSELSPPVETYDCTGFASGGELTVRTVENGRIIADLTIDFDMVPVHDYDVCSPQRVERSIEFSRRSLAELEPWEGRATGPYIPPEWDPQVARDYEWKVSSFVVEDAGEAEPRWHETLRERIAGGATPIRDWNFGILPHRIGNGHGTVFAYRSFSDHNYATDSAYGFKVTLFLEQPLPASPTMIRIGQAAGGKEAFASDWSNWGGCLAYASDGELRIVEVTGNHVAAHVRLNLDWVPIDGDFSSTCENDSVFEEDLLFERKAVENLTAWEGRSDRAAAQSTELRPQD